MSQTDKLELACRTGRAMIHSMWADWQRCRTQPEHAQRDGAASRPRHYLENVRHMHAAHRPAIYRQQPVAQLYAATGSKQVSSDPPAGSDSTQGQPRTLDARGRAS